ncbi:hypothetical protein J4218_00880 [Candidatus Pacearchaeota archaeon]|nr:hypothetical protein [Candidatus Pacearchaeota archaeon]
MKSTLSKQEINEKIKEVFSKNASREDIRKIKKLVSSKNIKLKEYKNKFCKKCFSLFNSNNSKIRIKKGFKTIICKCGSISRYKLK